MAGDGPSRVLIAHIACVHTLLLPAAWPAVSLAERAPARAVLPMQLVIIFCDRRTESQVLQAMCYGYGYADLSLAFCHVLWELKSR